jgi:hypothetical protein
VPHLGQKRASSRSCSPQFEQYITTSPYQADKN